MYLRQIQILALLFTLGSCQYGESTKEPEVNKSEVLKKLYDEDPFALDTYCNERFNYCIGYPLFYFFPLKESESGEGRVFIDKQGRETLRVFGKQVPYRNMKPVTLKMLYEMDVQQMYDEDVSGTLKIIRKEINQGSYILSGSLLNRIFHQKVIHKGHFFAYAILHYEIEERKIFDGIADKILQSFN